MDNSIRESYLKNMEDQERRLNEDRERLSENRNFYKSCLYFSLNQDDFLADSITSLVSSLEGEEYVIHKFSFTVPGHHETEYRSPYEGMPGVNGAELRATSVPHEVWVKEKTESKTVLVKKATAEMCGQLTFSEMRDYFASLDSILKNQKHFCLSSVIKLGCFNDDFDYLNEFLSRLVDWRLENKTLTIPKDVIDELLVVPDTSTEMKLSKKSTQPV